MTGTPSARRPGRNGALVAISCLMIGSAVVRLVFEASPLLAREAETVEPAPGPPKAPDAAELETVLAAFQEREIRISDRERQIEDRMRALQIADAAIERKMAALEMAEQSLRDMIALADVAAEDDLSKLTEVYERMKPKDAALLFEEMDPEFAAGFLGRMQSEAAAEILAGLSPGAAYTISVILAGRNASVPTD